MSEVSSKHTSSAESWAGPSPSSLPGGLQLGLSGLARVRVSRIVQQVVEAATTIPETFGPPSDASLRSAALQLSLGNRLRQSLAGYGSLEYALTWKRWAMPSGPPICALRASGHRTSGKDCIGWPTPNTGPQNDNDSTWKERREFLKAQHKNGNGFGLTLGMAAQLAGWVSPTTQDFSRGSKPPRSWDTGIPLTQQVAACSGTTSSLSPVPTASHGALNPAFSLWLMGYPSSWLMALPVKERRARTRSKASATP